MNLPRSIYPPLNIHFDVEFNSTRFKADRNFQSVQGLKARICKNEGEKEVRVQFENIVLKRAYQPDSKLVEWCMNAINNNIKEPIVVVVKLLNAQHNMLSGWILEEALPVAWGVDELHAQDTKILIETIELTYLRFQVMNSKGEVVAPIPKDF